MRLQLSLALLRLLVKVLVLQFLLQGPQQLNTGAIRVLREQSRQHAARIKHVKRRYCRKSELAVLDALQSIRVVFQRGVKLVHLELDKVLQSLTD